MSCYTLQNISTGATKNLFAGKLAEDPESPVNMPVSEGMQLETYPVCDSMCYPNVSLYNELQKRLFTYNVNLIKRQ